MFVFLRIKNLKQPSTTYYIDKSRSVNTGDERNSKILFPHFVIECLWFAAKFSAILSATSSFFIKSSRTVSKF